jgi:phosphate transport system ATP-binding protein
MEPQVRVAPQSDEPPKIEVRDVDFFYGKTQALKDVSLSVPAHAVTASAGTARSTPFSACVLP